LGYAIADDMVVFLNGSVTEILSVKLPPGKWLQLVNASEVDLNGLRIAEGYINIQPTSGTVFIRT